MQLPIRRSLALVAALALAACSRDTLPTGATADDLFASVTVDPIVGAEAGQSSELGLTMDPAVTYEGALGSATVCVYSTTSKRVECPPVTRGGLTFTRSIAFFDAAGASQTARDANTRSANTRIDVTGNATTPKGTLAIVRSSDLTVSGLGRAATTHTINGLETGKSSGTLTTDRGSVVLSEVTSSQAEKVVVPVPAKAGSYPLSGTTTRSGTTNATRAATGETRTSSWSEKVTYTGTNVVTVVITRDGKSKNCTRDLAAHKTTCS